MLGYFLLWYFSNIMFLYFSLKNGLFVAWGMDIDCNLFGSFFAEDSCVGVLYFSLEATWIMQGNTPISLWTIFTYDVDMTLIWLWYRLNFSPNYIIHFNMDIEDHKRKVIPWLLMENLPDYPPISLSQNS